MLRRFGSALRFVSESHQQLRRGVHAPPSSPRRRDMAVVLRFPLVRRRAVVSGAAWCVANAVPRTSVKRPRARAAGVQTETMSTRGISRELIAAETASLDAAVRVECWRVLNITGAQHE